MSKFDFRAFLKNSGKNKIIVCPDSFKGTISAVGVSNIIKDALLSVFPNLEIASVPIADGGEGTLDCFMQAAAHTVRGAFVKDAYFNKIYAEYLILENNTAVIEAAKVIGLYMIDKRDPSKTSTYGIGELLLEQAKQGAKILMALGGSSTNDGGAGIAAACGAKFIDKNGREFVPVGGTLANIQKIDVSNLISADITCMCDVENPLYGQSGAAYVFAPQKGADRTMVEELDKGLRNYSEKIKEYLGVDVSELKGGGAAGGIAGGLAAFFGAKLKSGIDTILDEVGFEKLLDGAALIITGEGKLDPTSFSGKVIGGIIRRAKEKGVPVLAVCGVLDAAVDIESSGLIAAYATNPDNRPFDEVKLTAEEDLKKTILKILNA